MKIGSIMWSSYMPSLVEAAQEISDLELTMCSMRDLEDMAYRAKFFHYLRYEAEVIILYPSTNVLWDEITADIEEIVKMVPTISFGHDPSLLGYNSVPAKVALTVQHYLSIGGKENSRNALQYIMKEVLQDEREVAPPMDIAWQGIFYPGQEELLYSAEDFMTHCCAYQPGKPTVGILFYRNMWLNNNTEVVEALIRELKQCGFNAIPAFGTGRRDPETGSEDNAYIIEQYFMHKGEPIIDALINLQSFFMVKQGARDRSATPSGTELLQKLNVPILKGLLTYGKTESEWRADSYGIGGPTMVMSVAMPECNGVIEPIVIGTMERIPEPQSGGTLEYYKAVPSRIQYICRRVKKWIQLRKKPISERKVAFILHNSPCHGTEMSVGGGANLDTLESMAGILARMQSDGYQVKNIPETGEALIKTIMERKAISDFRWTPIEEIVAKGGVLKHLSPVEYRPWFDDFPVEARTAMRETWGNPPGEEKDGVPAAMVYQGNILITGVEFGNAVVCAQPKRGCAGARCDGQVCKILHDPACPPTHQYVATYRYLEEIWGADVLVHVGTHGNLEFLPGKSLGLSERCFPEMTLGTLPHLYIYNTDNPPEGTIAKRRSYATLVGHMQTVMIEAAMYGALAELEDMLGEYRQALAQDPPRAHALEHLIMEKITEANITDINLQAEFGQIVDQAHGILGKLKNRRHQDGLHIFGQIPQGERRVDFIQAILRHDTGEQGSFSRLVAGLMKFEYDVLLDEPQLFHEKFNKIYGDLLQDVHQYTKNFIREFMQAADEQKSFLEVAQKVLGERLLAPALSDQLLEWHDKVQELDEKIASSREIDNLLRGFSGEYLAAGPSGLITRGRSDVLPTGRNFYSVDPERIPTRAAWRVGVTLASALLERHKQDTGILPENCGMVLFATDCMWTDGEQVAQILSLLGVEPKWVAGGRVKGFRIIPLEELGRPRIDVTIRIGGITRDCFPGIVEYLDEAIRAVALLDEPIEQNYIRKHTLAAVDDNDPAGWEKATARIFGSRPGTFGAGVSLAVHASAWETEQDLADIFLAWSGYAYGKGRSGQEAKQQFTKQLKTVDLTYNKAATDEYDIFGCCCQYSYYGGLTAAARMVSGNEVKTYFGDTRDPERATVVTLAEEVDKIIRVKILNPAWIEGMKRHGYKGAGDMAKRISHVYGWKATTGEVANWIFDDIARAYLLDEETRGWFEEQSPWALEEINRRLLEAAQRGLWQADPEVLAGIKETYLEIEGCLEEKMGDVQGEFQGSSIDIMTIRDVPVWEAKMKEKVAIKSSNA